MGHEIFTKDEAVLAETERDLVVVQRVFEVVDDHVLGRAETGNDEFIVFGDFAEGSSETFGNGSKKTGNRLGGAEGGGLSHHTLKSRNTLDNILVRVRQGIQSTKRVTKHKGRQGRKVTIGFNGEFVELVHVGKDMSKRELESLDSLVFEKSTAMATSVHTLDEDSVGGKVGKDMFVAVDVFSETMEGQDDSDGLCRWLPNVVVDVVPIQARVKERSVLLCSNVESLLLDRSPLLCI